jgi:transcriptional regulator with XRE-family HTH domain
MFIDMKKYDPLSAYLTMYRRRLGLSQREVAHILGAAVSATGISRHETGAAFPNIVTLLKYEILYGTTRDDLFEGFRAELLAEMTPNIRGLVRRLGRQRATPRTELKLVHLRRLIGEDGEA